jgi:hypothetical protein
VRGSPPIDLSFFLRIVYPVVAKTDMGKPLFKASDGGRVDILRQLEDATESELQRRSEM